MFRNVVIAFLLVLGSPLMALTDQSHDLRAILENGTLSKADCDRYKEGAHDRETTLRCGKWMFFYFSGDRPGMPARLLDLIRDSAPQEIGRSFEKVGMIPDPYSKEKLPLGMIKGGQLLGWVPTYTQTCAFCHLAKLPDGPYKVGQPNHELDFAKITLAVSLLPELALKPKKPLPAAVQKKMGPLIEEFYGKNWNRLKVIVQALRLIPTAVKAKVKPLTDENLEYWSQMPTGVMDVLYPPSVDDAALAPLRILPLWGLGEQLEGAPGFESSAMLTSTAGTPDLDHVFYAFPFITDLLTGSHLKEFYSGADYIPLAEYIKSLQAPVQTAERDSLRLERAQELFDRSCASCHNGPNYAGTKVFDLAEIGTDPNLKDMLLDPNGSGKIVAGIAQPYEYTGGVRATRLKGIWSLTRLLHNGSIHSLNELFCLEARQPAPAEGLSSEGHNFTCDGLTQEEKEDLIYWLNNLE